MDCTKALEHVRHTSLLHNIGASGVYTSSTDWLHSYLDNRLIRVRVGSTLAAEESVNARVPKGLILAQFRSSFLSINYSQRSNAQLRFTQMIRSYIREKFTNWKNTTNTDELWLQTAVRYAEH